MPGALELRGGAGQRGKEEAERQKLSRRSKTRVKEGPRELRLTIGNKSRAEGKED